MFGYRAFAVKSLAFQSVDNSWQTAAMRWQRLFDDLEMQLDAAHRQDFEAEVADRTRRELALVHMADRLAGAAGRAVQLTVTGVGVVVGTIARTGDGWLLLADGSGRDVVVRLDAVIGATGLPAAAATEPGRLESKLGLGHLLRGIARDRTAVVIGLVDGSSVEGTIDRVGADFVDLAVHPLDEPRRQPQVVAERTLAFRGVAIVRSR
jgi:hypothetical protein